MSFADVKRLLIGEPFPTSREVHERLDKVRALAVFAPDPISSNAYATEAIMGVLGSWALNLTLPLALAVAVLVLMVIFSYIQTILHCPDGGGAYTVAKDNLGRIPSLLAGGALLTDYIRFCLHLAIIARLRRWLYGTHRYRSHQQWCAGL